MSTSLLTEKFRPRSIDDFIGLDKPKRILSRFAANPYASAWLFVGKPGLGKTTMAMALADAIPAERHHIPSQDCNLDRLKDVIARCHYIPRMGLKMHLVHAAQLYLLSKLDSTAIPPNTVFVFTANDAEPLEDRFISRCSRVDFSSYASGTDAATFLEIVWESEAPADAEKPNFARIVKEATGNLRASLMRLQNELLLA